ncbi:hypothetical protein BJV82DRAFT_669583 [Fennellomyces sp. T-0311]|nr:hypothetical protein BJV82DRAFT_669583 [Fennellomyces sp. T-0311]
MDKSSTEQTKNPMTQQDASRIQSHTDRTGKNPGFKECAQSTADKAANHEKKK